MENLTARRFSRNQFGTISHVTGDDGQPLFLFYEPTNPIPSGQYTCIRGDHPIHKNTFELQAVPGYTGILIHVGNGAADTKGCLLPGMSVGFYWPPDSNDPKFGVRDSRIAYEKMMKIMEDTDAFKLTILDCYPDA